LVVRQTQTQAYLPDILQFQVAATGQRKEIAADTSSS